MSATSRTRMWMKLQMANATPREVAEPTRTTTTNTKTSVRDIKRRLGILDVPEEEDKWAQFNRRSKKIYDENVNRLDVEHTWGELPWHLRQDLLNTTCAAFPDEWQNRYDQLLLKDICNIRLFRLHHLRRLKSNKSGEVEQLSDEAADMETDMMTATTATRSSSAQAQSEIRRTSLPFDPVRHAAL